MNSPAAPVIIRKYANRRLYHTGTSTYVTLDDLARMVRDKENFIVEDAKSGEDLTHSILTQIIVDQESKGHNLLPENFLRELIGLYGGGVDEMVPEFLEHALAAFSRGQQQLQEQMQQSIGQATHQAMRAQLARNAEIFVKSLEMFSPLPPHAAGAAPGADAPGGPAGSPAATSSAAHGQAGGPVARGPGAAPAADKGRSTASADEVERLKDQLSAMQAQLDKLSKSRR